MPNNGRLYPDEIGQLKRIKEILGLSNADIYDCCVEFCKVNPRYTVPSIRTIDKVYAKGSEGVTFSLATIQTLTAVSTYMEQAQNAHDAESNDAIAEQAQLLRITVERKNARIEELEARVAELEARNAELEADNADLSERKDFFKAQYERMTMIVEALSKK